MSSDRKITVSTIENAAQTHVVVIDAMHINGNFRVESRVWKRSNDGMMSTDLFGGAFSTDVAKAPRYNAKRLQEVADQALSLSSTQHDYERLIAKAEYAKLGFPKWSETKQAA